MDDSSKTKELIKYLIYNMNLPTITSITKMLYLIDLAAVSSAGKKITNLNFIRYYYGPYDSSIKNILDEMILKHETDVDVKFLPNGEPYLVYRSPKGVAECLYNGDNENIVNDLVNDLGHLSPKSLTEIAYKTKPMMKLNATLGGNEHLNETLDLSEV